MPEMPVPLVSVLFGPTCAESVVENARAAMTVEAMTVEDMTAEERDVLKLQICIDTPDRYQ